MPATINGNGCWLQFTVAGSVLHVRVDWVPWKSKHLTYPKTHNAEKVNSFNFFFRWKPFSGGHFCTADKNICYPSKSLAQIWNWIKGKKLSTKVQFSVCLTFVCESFSLFALSDPSRFSFQCERSGLSISSGLWQGCVIQRTFSWSHQTHFQLWKLLFLAFMRLAFLEIKILCFILLIFLLSLVIRMVYIVTVHMYYPKDNGWPNGCAL